MGKGGGGRAAGGMPGRETRVWKRESEAEGNVYFRVGSEKNCFQAAVRVGRRKACMDFQRARTAGPLSLFCLLLWTG